MQHTRFYALVGLVTAFGCASMPEGRQNASNAPESDGAQRAFWTSLQALCGQSFEGRLVESQPADASFEGQRFVMHVRECESDEIRIPFIIGENRSRTWVITRTDTGLRLKHDHRHEDGREDEVTQYGGDTHAPGTAAVQDFHADTFTANLIPAASTNVWTLQLEPGRIFSYALRREGADRRFRVDFDLQRPVETPPPPWDE